jgi:heptaprenyl diphosphate synthase
MGAFWAGHPQIAVDLEEIRLTILRRAASEDPEVHGAVQHLFAAGGKMLRPGFVLLASRFGNPERDRILRVAAAVEMLHMATLVHDDIIDGAITRRGEATLHSLRGPRVAVLTGDWLLAASVSLVADLGTIDDARALARMVSRICGSEISQSTYRFVVHTSLRRYLRRIAGKTAALFALSFYAGAVEGRCSTQMCSILRRVGYTLGMGFQIVDDILDFNGAPAHTGKPTGRDLSQGIITLPTILGLRRDDGRLAAAISRRPRSRRAFARAARLVADRGGLAGAREVAGDYARRSRREILRLPAGEPREALLAVTNALLERRS